MAEPRTQTGRDTFTQARPVSRARVVEAALLLIPLAYGGYLLSALLHTLVGHGLIAWLVGGHFDAFQMRLNGMAHADVYVMYDRTIWRSAMIAAGGIVVTFAVGYVLMRLAGRRVTAKPVRATAMAVIGMNCVLGSMLYLFWGSLYETGYGDAVSFIELTALQQGAEQHTLRWMMIVVGGLGAAVGWFAGFSLLTRSITAMIAPDWPLTHRQHVMLVTGFLVMPSALLALVFDWEAVIPTVSPWPQLMGVALTLLAGVWACRRVSTDHIRLVHDADTHAPDGTPTQPDPERVDHPPRLVVPIVLAWLFLLVQVLAIVFALSDGVRWG